MRLDSNRAREVELCDDNRDQNATSMGSLDAMSVQPSIMCSIGLSLVNLRPVASK